MSDLMSNDQIDDLLNQDGFNKADPALADDAGDGATGAGKNYDALSQTFEIFRIQAGTVLTTLINKTVAFEITQCAAADTGFIATAYGGSCIAVKTPLDGAVTGALNVLLGKPTVAMLSDLMMMGDGNAPYAEEHKDAIGEILNQVMGSFTTAMSNSLGISASAGQIEVAELEGQDALASLGDADMVAMKIRVEQGEPSDVIVLVSSELSDKLMSMTAGAAPAAQQDSGGGTGLNEAEINDLSDAAMPTAEEFGDGAQPGAMTQPSHGVSRAPAGSSENIEVLLDVELDVSIELGRTNLSVKRILELAPGAIVELDRMAGEPVDLMVNNKVVAKGEVVIVDENFGIRIVSLVSQEDRIRSLR